MRLILVFVFFFTVKNIIFAQCTMHTVVNSSEGYAVAVSLTLTEIIAPSACPHGYNFNIRLNYDISFTGNTSNATLYTLQGNIVCGPNNDNFFDLPNGGGIGNTVSGGNSWRPISDCNSATPTSLSCNTIQLTIHGNGIPHQVINLPCTSTLPIELVYFSVEEKTDYTELNWMTHSELNNDFFEIQKSTDGINWASIDQLKGAGTTSLTQTYSWFDYTRVTSPISYYRLKQVDFDGTYTFYDIQSVSHRNFNMFIAPNPARSYTVIHTDSSVKMNELRVYNTQGQELSLSSNAIQIDEHRIKLNTSDFSKGIYFIHYENSIEKLIVD